MKRIFLLCLLLVSISMNSQILQGVKDKVKGATSGAASALTNDEVVKGLKEALTIGTNNSASLASKLDGFNKNPQIYIPWPPEAQQMKAKLIQLGFQKKIQEFETSLNRAAEQAALKAANRSEGTKANPVTIRKRTWDKEGARFQGMT